MKSLCFEIVHQPAQPIGAGSRRGALAGLLLFASIATAAPPRFAGLTLAEALQLLQHRGLQIVYTTALVRPEMRVAREPAATAPRTILDEILAPHGLRVREGPGHQLVIVLAPRRESRAAPPRERLPVYLDGVVVTPSRHRLEREDPEYRHSLGAEEIESMPHAGNDLYWSVKRLPGTTAPDVSARFNVRGGEADELLVVLDGVELYEPFHFKDFQNLFSIVDSSAVGGVDLLTGGFPVEYGNHLSGVMDISTRVPSGGATGALLLGTIQSGILTSGSLNGDRTQWLATARGWYPDVLLDASGLTTDALMTDYYDFFGKVSHHLGDRTIASAGVLAAYDDLGFSERAAEEHEVVRARYDSEHFWLNLQTVWTPRISSRTVVDSGDVYRHRTGGASDIEEGTLAVEDRRRFDVVGFKQDWTWDVADRHFLKFGGEVKRQTAEYDYSRLTTPSGEDERQNLEVQRDPRGESYGLYAADRFRLGESLVVELGLRWDKQFWIDDEQISPRVTVMYTAASGPVVRAAWGRYWQSQQLNELQIEDGVDRFQPAQLAEHWLLSLEQRLPGGMSLRVEAYDKELRNVRPRYENLFNAIELFPEAQDDRVLVAPQSGRAYGVELLLKSEPARRLNWWGSYALARSFDEIAGRDVPRSQDQRHTATFSVARDFAGGWTASLGGTYHSGWPATTMVAVEREDGLELEPGPRNAHRFPDYYRLDGRVTRSFATRLGRMTVIGEVMNLTGARNACCIDDFVAVERDNGDIEVEAQRRYWPRVIPSLAVRWDF